MSELKLIDDRIVQKTTRPTIAPRLRFKVLQRDNFTCQYCGRKSPDVELEVDHIIPISKGGIDSIENLQTSCRGCNIGKSAEEIIINTDISISQEPNLERYYGACCILPELETDTKIISLHNIKEFERLTSEDNISIEQIKEWAKQNHNPLLKSFAMEILPSSMLVLS